MALTAKPTPGNTMEYVVYCDESRHCKRDADSHMAIGGLWVRRDARDALSHDLRNIARHGGLRSEVKWSKVSDKYLPTYTQLVDFFFDSTNLNFRSIVVDHRKFDPSFHNGDAELGFYKFYYRMLEKWLMDGSEYTILLDFKMNRGADRFGDLRRVLSNTRPGAVIRELAVIDSATTPLAQLSDLLVGAIAAMWCGVGDNGATTAKARLAAHFAQRAGWRSLRTTTAGPQWTKLNVFAIDLISGSEER